MTPQPTPAALALARELYNSLAYLGNTYNAAALRLDRFAAERASQLVGAMRSMSGDMHNVSSRPCPTCRVVSDAMGEPFGCYAFQARITKAETLRDAAMKASGNPTASEP